MIFEWRGVVRDYELDCQGVVNNSNYLRYMEHARHQHLRSLGIDFAGLHRSGIDLVLVRSVVEYKYPLYGGDKYRVTSEIIKLGKIRFGVRQRIFLADEEKMVADGNCVCVAVNAVTRRPMVFAGLWESLGVE